MTELCRRSVLKGAAATCGLGLLAACGDGGADGRADDGGDPAGLRVSLADLSEIPVGGAVSATAPDGKKVLITQPRQGEAVAFSAVCTHQGCTVEPDGGQLSCPCHGSQFELSGEVKRGPAAAPLRPYDVRVVDGRVLPG